MPGKPAVKPSMLSPAEARQRPEEHRKLLARIEARCVELDQQLDELEARLPKLEESTPPAAPAARSTTRKKPRKPR
jgi:uncharacterized membrane protein YccC